MLNGVAGLPGTSMLTATRELRGLAAYVVGQQLGSIYSHECDTLISRTSPCRNGQFDLLPARRYASAVFATATCLSVRLCLSVCPSVTRRYCA